MSSGQQDSTANAPSGAGTETEAKPNDPCLFLAGYKERVPQNVQEMDTWMVDMKATLLARLRYTQRASAEEEVKSLDDSNPTISSQINQKLKRIGSIWEKWLPEHDVVEGEIRDSKRLQQMINEIAEPYHELHEYHLNNKTWAKKEEHMFAQQCWEDFLYYQNEWNRRGPPWNVEPIMMSKRGIQWPTNDAYVGWLSHLISLYDKFQIGSRENMPDRLTPEDAHRYSNSIRHTTPFEGRLSHLRTKFPHNDKEVHYDWESFNQAREHLSGEQVEGKFWKMYHEGGKKGKWGLQTSFEDGTWGSEPTRIRRDGKAQKLLHSNGSEYLELGQWRIFPKRSSPTGTGKSNDDNTKSNDDNAKSKTHPLIEKGIRYKQKLVKETQTIQQIDTDEQGNPVRDKSGKWKTTSSDITIEKHQPETDAEGALIRDHNKYYEFTARAYAVEETSRIDSENRQSRRHDYGSDEFSADEDSAAIEPESDTDVGSPALRYGRRSPGNSEHGPEEIDFESPFEGDLFQKSYRECSSTGCSRSGTKTVDPHRANTEAITEDSNDKPPSGGAEENNDADEERDSNDNSPNPSTSKLQVHTVLRNPPTTSNRKSPQPSVMPSHLDDFEVQALYTQLDIHVEKVGLVNFAIKRDFDVDSFMGNLRNHALRLWGKERPVHVVRNRLNQYARILTPDARDLENRQKTGTVPSTELYPKGIRYRIAQLEQQEKEIKKKKKKK
ncbi:hypothetical protein BU24DRAFT_404066 [Aaosphaeria arxii CBS 175.79]|uniref:Uncharacterized protein n=1 Tax=Aaosphaeria arxii CBS 175.79 TaxID=1450172 RepID=A0A6A5Y622_9PLEO|nr:uncharacterized protein BU24DRAFT_404066 [Aaosphaeria arxii CBS 175.79]KAF2021005.1 hypothetical protein BU24DRAFT_404066 [Aaosphaeria arxii CBS 175.79]